MLMNMLLGIACFCVAMIAKSAWKYTLGPSVDNFFATLTHTVA